MAAYPTPHINATPADFAETVLMPGDPLRSKFVAENFLEGAKLVNNVRGVQGYTGLYKGKPVSVMASGMGIPSIGIYSYELFNFFGVENIIRIGSAGSLQDHIHLRDVVIAEGACTNSNYCSQFDLRGEMAVLRGLEKPFPDRVRTRIVGDISDLVVIGNIMGKFVIFFTNIKHILNCFYIHLVPLIFLVKWACISCCRKDKSRCPRRCL